MHLVLNTQGTSALCLPLLSLAPFVSTISLFHTNTSGPPIITAETTQQAVKHSKGKLECLVGSSPPPDKIVSIHSPISVCVCLLGI